MHLDYGKQFVLRVRDNGRGMETSTIQSGKLGHFGLHGMRERTQRIGGKLTILSPSGLGTEIALSVPGSSIYAREGRFKKLIRLIKRP